MAGAARRSPPPGTTTGDCFGHPSAGAGGAAAGAAASVTVAVGRPRLGHTRPCERALFRQLCHGKGREHRQSATARRRLESRFCGEGLGGGARSAACVHVVAIGAHEFWHAVKVHAGFLLERLAACSACCFVCVCFRVLWWQGLGGALGVCVATCPRVCRVAAGGSAAFCGQGGRGLDIAHARSAQACAPGLFVCCVYQGAAAWLACLCVFMSYAGCGSFSGRLDDDTATGCHW